MVDANEQLRLQTIQDYKNVFAGEAGQRVLDDLKGLTTINQNAIPTGQAIDTGWLIYAEAQRVFVLNIIAKINVDIEAQSQEIAESEENEDE